MAHPPLCELGAATLGVEADDQQVAGGVALTGIGDLTLDDGDLGGNGEGVPSELDLARLVLMVLPLAHDLVLALHGRLYGSQA